MFGDGIRCYGKWKDVYRFGTRRVGSGGSWRCSNVGLIPRTLSYIINGMNSPEFKQTFDDSDDMISLEMSYLEDYQNNIYDLLSPSPRYGQSKSSLNVRLDTQGVLHVTDLTVGAWFVRHP